MILDLTSDELKAAKALDDSYEKLLNDQKKKIAKLRPDAPTLEEEIHMFVLGAIPKSGKYVELAKAIKALHEERSRNFKKEPPKPEPIQYDENGTPIYSKEELDAYYNSDEYKAYRAEDSRIWEEMQRLEREYDEAGTQAWRDAREKYKALTREYEDAVKAFFQKVEDRQFNALGDDLYAILSDAQSQVDRMIPNAYRYYENMRKTGSFSARGVRAQDDGSFLLDTTEERENIRRELKRHIDRLSEDPKLLDVFNLYLEDALRKSELVGTTGKRGGLVEKKKYDGELVIRPDKYVTTVDRLSLMAFSNELMRPDDAADDALYEIRLDRKGKVYVGSAIDYTELLKTGDIQGLPELTRDDYDVHDAIVTQLYAGNRTMTYDMIYRAMTGKVDGKVTVPDDARDQIDAALAKFKSRITIEYHAGTDKDGNKVDLRINEPIVTFTQATALINGKRVKDAIIIPQDVRFDPPLLKWARFNRNEIDTRDIKLLDVPKLNNGNESRNIKMTLYRRLIKMRNTFERKGKKYELDLKQRTIRYDYVYEALGITDPDKAKRNLLKDKIDRCMKYWLQKGFISGYEHKRDKSSGNAYYAVAVSFLPKE